ncbi:MAG: PAS domain-containing sensor histidine kinase [Synechococcales bacterium]|nr:PAS domain-containing sensor histidine kinase [Synechococcales bacterium]
MSQFKQNWYGAVPRWLRRGVHAHRSNASKDAVLWGVTLLCVLAIGGHIILDYHFLSPQYSLLWLLFFLMVGLLLLLLWTGQLIQAMRRYAQQLEQVNQELSQQIVERQQVEEALQDYAATLQDIYNNAPCGYHSVDVNGNVVLINDTELRMLGYQRETVVGQKKFVDLLAPDSISLWLEKFEQLKQQGWVRDVELYLKHRQGEIFPVLINATAVRDSEGQYVMSRSTVVDLRERKQVELALQQREAHYRAIVEDQTELICRFLHDGRLTFVNQAYCRYFGKSASELLGQTFRPMIPPEDWQVVERHFQALSPTTPVVTYEHRVMLSNGEIRWQQWTDRVILEPSGQVVEYQAVGQDITIRKQVEADLLKLSKALETAVVGISEINREGRYLKMNAAHAEMMGCQIQDLLGVEWWKGIHRDDRRHALQAYQTLLARDRAEVDVRIVRKDGSLLDQRIVMVKAFDQNQHCTGHYGFTRDISERRDLDRLKDEFISIASHELKTPLTALSGALDLLAGGLLQHQPEQAQKMIQIAIQNTERLMRLVNDILDIERIKSGKISINPQVCSVAELVQQAVEVMQPLAKQAQINLITQCEPEQVWGDRDRVIQVLINLISNAIKFSNAGHTVWITVNHWQSGNSTFAGNLDATLTLPESAGLLFQVRDQGRGIPIDKQQSIFEPFQQVDASDSRQKGGTGLGLAICRTILQQHGSPFWLHSTPGEGSAFYFILPQSSTVSQGNGFVSSL